MPLIKIFRVGLLLSLLPIPAPAQGLDVHGHRGAGNLRPENSLPAFQKALELGVTTLELDVQVTRDGIAVVHHDEHLNPRRCVDASGRPVEATPIRRLDAADLEGIDCGLRPPRGQEPIPGTHIPRLAEVLELARDAPYPVRLNVEVKRQEPSLGPPARESVEIVLAEVERYGLGERTILQSFDAEVLVAARELEPGIRRSLLVRYRRHFDRLQGEDLGSVLSPRYKTLKERDVERFQAAGVEVIPWTVNKPKAIRRLIRWGVDGMISDYPDRVIEIAGEEGVRVER